MPSAARGIPPRGWLRGDTTGRGAETCYRRRPAVERLLVDRFDVERFAVERFADERFPALRFAVPEREVAAGIAGAGASIEPSPSSVLVSGESCERSSLGVS